MLRYDIPAYLDFLPERLLERLWEDAEAIDGVEGLRVARGLRDEFPNIETDEALAFVCALYEEVKAHLDRVLKQRVADRELMDAETLACVARNKGVEYTSAEYATVMGLKDDANFAKYHLIVYSYKYRRYHSPQVFHLKNRA